MQAVFTCPVCAEEVLLGEWPAHIAEDMIDYCDIVKSKKFTAHVADASVILARSQLDPAHIVSAAEL